MGKIAVNTVKAFLKEHRKEQVNPVKLTVGDSSFEAHIKTGLTADEQSLFVSRVAGSVFDAAGDYRPEWFEPVFRATVLQMMTDLPPLTKTVGEGEDKRPVLDTDAMSELYGLLFGNIWEVTADVTNLRSLCYEAVEWRKARILHGTGMDISRAAKAIEELANTLSKQVESVDSKALLEYAGKLTALAGDFDQGALVKAILKERDSGEAE